MTTSPQPPPAAEKTVGQFLRPLRDLAVYALIGAPAVFLFVAVIDLFGADFMGQTRWSFGGFVNLETVVLPFAAVLLALGVKPVHPKARLITLIAIVEYGVASFFGVIFGLLFGVSGMAAQDAGQAFSALLVRVAWLVLLALPAYAVVQIWLSMFTRPKQQPGVYGQAPYGPQQYGRQPFGAQPFSAPPFSAPPFSAPPAAPFQPGVVPQPGGPLAPPGATYGAPPAATQPFHAGQSPYGQYPAVPPPAWGQPVPPTSGAPYADATQPVPPPPPAPAPPAQAPADQTTVLPPDRPGFGPADQDPPRQ